MRKFTLHYFFISTAHNTIKKTGFTNDQRDNEDKSTTIGKRNMCNENMKMFCSQNYSYYLKCSRVYLDSIKILFKKQRR